jgi:hypothetical protein
MYCRFGCNRGLLRCDRGLLRCDRDFLRYDRDLLRCDRGLLRHLDQRLQFSHGHRLLQQMPLVFAPNLLVGPSLVAR